MKRLLALALAALVLGGAAVADDGDVLTFVDPQVGGKSQVFRPAPNRWVDLGTLDITDLLSGPITLYTPTSGEILMNVLFLGTPVAFDAGAFDFQTNLDDSTTRLGDGGGGVWHDTALMHSVAFYPVADGLPLRAIYAPQIKAPGTWQANHLYTVPLDAPFSDPLPQAIVAAGHVWSTNTTGTSGGSAPDFAGNIGGTTPADGTIPGWFDEGVVPTTGSAHLLLYVAKAGPP